MTLVIIVLLLLGASTIGFTIWKRRFAFQDEDPILLFDAQGERGPMAPTPRPTPGRAPRRARDPDPGPAPAPGPDPEPAPPVAARPTFPDAAPSPPASVPPGASTTAPPEAPTTAPSETVEAGPVRFERAAEGTLQLLPGRFVIESDAGRGEEIRFVRVPGTPARITFGRSSGPAHRHVQLQSPTVSRMHAEMRFEDGAWILLNRSTTNPTLLNGRSLVENASGTELQDGDRVEMGEVAFLFHQPEGHDRLATRSSWHTDRALRPVNQDAVLVRTLPGRRELAVVCDGMGSHEAGGVASRLALETLTAEVEKGESLGQAAARANASVRKTMEGDNSLEGMGTTMVALLREKDRYTIANVGDSRAYRVDAGGIRQVTRDHSFVAEAIASGEMSPEEAQRSPWRHAITRNLGGSDQVEVDLFPGGSAEEAHVVVLCSDGIHGVLDDEAIARVVRVSPHIRDTARLLCEEAIRKGTQDNVTAVVLAFGGGVAEEPD
jgi:PPM family protein phosphatase